MRYRALKDPVKNLLLDARYEKSACGWNGSRYAFLIACGVMEDGHRRVFGVRVKMSEAETHWRQFLESQIESGLHGARLITSDNHLGLKNG